MIRVGLTFDLKDHYLELGFSPEDAAEFDSVATVESIEGALRRRGFVTDRIGTVKQLAARLVAGERWDFVFNIAEGVRGVAREAQVPALLDAYDIPYVFSDPLVLALTLHKGMTKQIVRDRGVPTAPFAVVEDLGDLAAITLPYPLFAKPVAEGTGKGVTPASRAKTPEALRSVCADLLERFRQPVLVETYLPGREFTVGITGTGARAAAVGVMEVVLGARAESGIYTYANKAEYEDRVSYRLAEDAAGREAERVALAAWRALSCRDGGRIDIRCDAAGQPQFLEVNPLAGLHPVDSDLPIMARLAGITYDALLGRIIDSALQRIALPLPARAAAE